MKRGLSGHHRLAEKRPCPLQFASMDVNLSSTTTSKKSSSKLWVTMYPLSDVHSSSQIHRRIYSAQDKVTTILHQNVIGTQLQVVFAPIPLQRAINGQGLHLPGGVQKQPLPCRNHTFPLAEAGGVRKSNQLRLLKLLKL